MSQSAATAQELDSQYPTYQSDFNIPTFGSLDIPEANSRSNDKNQPVIYLCGNSLGLMPKQTRQYVNDELDAWSQRAVESHFRHPGQPNGKTSWVDIDLPVVPLIASIVGALDSEAAVMGSLTANLNALLTAFYKPEGKKTKILFEKGSFPSDYYSFLNQVKLKDFGDAAENHLIQLSPRKGEYHLRTEDILKSIEDNKDEIAVVLLPGVQYYTGQLFEIQKITKFAKDLGLVVGWDLAHAVGNVPLRLHDWGVDFAAWCSYKYLNSGPGGIAGIFVHESHHDKEDNFTARLAGWWGNKSSKRFQMLEHFEPIPGALGFRQSNPSVIDVVSLKSSLDIFAAKGGVETLRSKSIALTNFLESLLHQSKYYIDPKNSSSIDPTQKGFTILTPSNPEERGAQLSVLFFPSSSPEKAGIMGKISTYLNQHGVICDERKPDVVRITPIPLYNSFSDVYNAVEILESAFESI